MDVSAGKLKAIVIGPAHDRVLTVKLFFFPPGSGLVTYLEGKTSMLDIHCVICCAILYSGT